MPVVTLDWIDLLVVCAALAGAWLVWRISGRRKDREISRLRDDLSAMAADPQAAMMAFLESGGATLKTQAEDLHNRIVALEVEIARKRKRLSGLEKQPGRKEGELAFQQEGLEILNRRLAEYQIAARRTAVQQARGTLFHRRLSRGDLNAALVPRYIEEADKAVEEARKSGFAWLREAQEGATTRGALSDLAAWRLKMAEERRLLPPVKRRLAK